MNKWKFNFKILLIISLLLMPNFNAVYAVGKDIIDSSIDKYISQGLSYYRAGNFDKALNVWNKVLQLDIDVYGELSRNTARAYYAIGLIYDEMGENNMALNSYYQAINIFQKINSEDYKNIGTIYCNIANIYYAQMDYDRALATYNKSLDLLMRFDKNNPDIDIIKKYIEISKSKMEIYKTIPLEISQQQNLVINNLKNPYNSDSKGLTFYNYRCGFFKQLKKLEEKFAFVEGASEEDIKSINIDLSIIGIKAKISEGMIYFVEDNDFSSQKFTPYLGEEWNDFYAIRKSENNELFDDGSLIITKEELRRRIINWECFLNKYPNFPENNEIKAKLNCYISTYLRSQYDFSTEDNKIAAESVESFNNFLNENTDSKFYPIVKKWINLLEKNSYKYTNGIEKFKYKSPYKIKKYNDDIFDSFSP